MQSGLSASHNPPLKAKPPRHPQFQTKIKANTPSSKNITAQASANQQNEIIRYKRELIAQYSHNRYNYHRSHAGAWERKNRGDNFYLIRTHNRCTIYAISRYSVIYGIYYATSNVQGCLHGGLYRNTRWQSGAKSPPAQ